jgi:hypothetical protein
MQNMGGNSEVLEDCDVHSWQAKHLIGIISLS